MRLLGLIVAAVLPASQPSTEDVLGKAAGAAVQADAVRALDLIKDVNPSTLSAKDRDFVTCMRQRFGAAVPPGAPSAQSSSLSDRTVELYRDYWRAAMLRPDQRAVEEKRLEASLQRLLGSSTGLGMDSLEPVLAEALKKEGFHSLQGRTGLLRELMIWSRQDMEDKQVELPEGRQEVRVVLLNDFKSLGWGYYAACGRRGAGGWATKEALFAIVPRYESLESEEFRVSFLGHEAQHFADLSQLQGLKSWELEYRAKLTELAQAEATRAKVLRKFIEDQGDDPASPHSFANRRVLAALVQRLQLGQEGDLLTVELPRLQRAARELLLEDSARRIRIPAPQREPD